MAWSAPLKRQKQLLSGLEPSNRFRNCGSFLRRVARLLAEPVGLAVGSGVDVEVVPEITPCAP